MPEIKIRLLEPEDSLDALTELLHLAYAPLAEVGLLFVATHQTVEVTRERCERGTCWVAEADGILIGTIALYTGQSSSPVNFYQQDRLAVFGQFGVHPDYKGKGVGKGLYMTAEEFARRRGDEIIALDTAEGATHVIELYQRWGFEVVDHHKWDSTNYRSVIMARKL